MVINEDMLNALTEQAKSSSRLRAPFDLRNTSGDSSQRMLNAIEPGTEMPIHRHKGTSETCLKCLESGTVLLEAKDGPYQPLSPEDIMEVKSEK